MEVESLDFKVILNDAEFNKQIQADLKAATELNTQLSRLLEVKKAVNNITSTAGTSSLQKEIQMEKEALKLETERATAKEKVTQAEMKTAQAVANASAAQAKAAKAATSSSVAQATAESKIAEAASRAATAKNKEARSQNELTRSALQLEAQQRKNLSLDEQRTRAAQQTTASYSAQAGVLRELASIAAMYFSVRGISSFVGNMVRVTGEFETQRIALRSILQDSSAADTIYNQIKELAIQSPYTFQDLIGYTKQMAAFQIPMEDLYDTTKRLADVSAGLGVDMGRVILAYGQVNAATYLRGQEVRQFTEAGIPILKELAKLYGELEGRMVSVGEVQDRISKRMVAFNDVAEVFRRMTDEGGIFYNMQSVLASTVKGKIEKLKDSYEQLLNQIGESNSGTIHGVLDALVSLVQNFELVQKMLKQLISVYGTYKIAQIAVAASTGTLATSTLGLVKVVRTLMTFLKGNWISLAVSGVVLLANIIQDLAGRLSSVEKIQKQVTDATKEYTSNVTTETVRIGYYFDAVKNATKGTEDYRRAKEALLENAGQYLTEADKEAIAMDNLAGVYDRLAESIRRSAIEKAFSEGKSKIAQSLADGLSDAWEKFTDKKQDRAAIYGVNNIIQDYIEGAIPNTDDFETAMENAFNKWYEGIHGKSDTPGSKLDMAGFGRFKQEFIPMAKEIRSEMENVKQAASDATADLQKSLKVANDVLNAQGSSTTKTLTDWQQIAADIINNSGKQSNVTNIFGVTPETVFSKFKESVRKAYNEANKVLADSSSRFEQKEHEVAKEQAELAKQLATSLEFSLQEPKAPSTSSTISKAEKNNSELISSLKDRIETLKEMKSQYEALATAMNDPIAAEEKLREMYSQRGVEIDSLDFDTMIAAETAALEALGETATTMNEKLSDTKEDIDKITKGYEDAFKAGREFIKEMNSWTLQNFALFGEGISYDIGKEIGDTISKNAAVDQKASELAKKFEKAMGNEGAVREIKKQYGEIWDSYVQQGEDAVWKIANAEKEANNKALQEKIKGLGQTYVDNVMKIDKKSVNRRSLKSVYEILKGYQKALKDVMDDTKPLVSQEQLQQWLFEGKITQEQYDQMVGNSLGELKDDIKKILKGEIKNWTATEFQLIATAAGKASQAIRTLGDSIEKVFGDTEFGDVANKAANLIDVLKQTMDGFSQGGVPGAVFGFLTGSLTLVVEELGKNKEAIEQNIETYKELKRTFTELKYQMSSDAETIWGTNDILKAREALEKARDAAGNYSGALENVKKSLTDATGYLALSHNYGLITPEGLEALKSYGDLVDHINQEGISIWKDDGSLDLERLGEYLNGAKDILQDEDLRDMLQDVYNLGTAYEELEKEINSLSESWVGAFASDAIDIMIDNVKNGVDAVDGLSSAYENLGETIVKSMMQSALMETVLSDFTGRFNSMIKRYIGGESTPEEYMAEMDGAVEELRDRVNLFGEAWEPILQSMQGYGLLGSGDSSSSSASTVSESIKGVTEETASLLASYINAIRADVSYGKTQRNQIIALLQGMSGGEGTPTLMEYMMQVSAHTQNIAANTQQIMLDFQSILVPSDEGGNAIKVNN